MIQFSIYIKITAKFMKLSALRPINDYNVTEEFDNLLEYMKLYIIGIISTILCLTNEGDNGNNT